MLDLVLARPAHRRLPGRHVDGHGVLVQRQPGHAAAAKYYEGIDLIMKAWQATEPFAFNGRFNQHALRQPGARARGSNPTRRSGSRAAARSRPGTSAPRTTSSTARSRTTATCWRERPSAATGAGSRRTARTTTRTAWRSPQFIGVGRHRRRGLQAVPRAGRVLLQPLAARVPGLHRSARLRHRGVGARPLQVAGAPGGSHQAGQARPHVGRDGRERLRRHRQPRHGARDSSRRRRKTFNCGHLLRRCCSSAT